MTYDELVAQYPHEAGVVTWMETPPVGVAFVMHRLSLMDAVKTAGKFLGVGGEQLIHAGDRALGLLEDLPEWTCDDADHGYLICNSLLLRRKDWVVYHAPDLVDCLALVGPGKRVMVWIEPFLEAGTTAHLVPTAYRRREGGVGSGSRSIGRARPVSQSTPLVPAEEEV